MLIGLVKWFDNEKGFGAIGTPSEGEFFLHLNNFIKRPEKITKGTAIIFKKLIDNKKNRNNAVNCRLISKQEDWSVILTLLAQPDNVSIENEIKGKSRHGNSYLRKETNIYSTKKLATRQLFKEKSEEEIKYFITDYFDKELDKNLFIPYCEFIEERIEKTFQQET